MPMISSVSDIGYPSTKPITIYHTWQSKPGTGRAGMDYILAVQKHIHQASISGIDHELSSQLLKSNHYLVFISFTLHCFNTSPTLLINTYFDYRWVAQITFKKIYPKDYNDNTPSWCVPKTINILLNDIRSHTKIHNAPAITQYHTNS